MNCFPCFSSQKSKKETGKGDLDFSFDELIQSKVPENMEASNQAELGNIAAQTFTFRELAAATKNFRQESLLGEGGFGKVYKGTLQATGQVVAVKQLDRNAMQGNKEFLVEVAQLSLLQHPNLVNLIGYCADGDQRLLVYEFMPGGSVEDHLLDMKGEGKPLEWITRMKIAYGVAQGLEYLHDKTNPPVIYRDLKSSNVLLDEQLNPKLSDIGLDKLGPSAEKMPMQSRAMGTYGYSAPEFSRSGRLTTIADVYSFGVVLLELITGRRVIDTTKPVNEQNLVAWAQPIFREPKRFPEMADPLLKKRFPERGLNQAVGIAAMCLQDEAAARPLMSDVVTALSFLSMAAEENSIPPSISSELQFMECTGDEYEIKLKKQDSSVRDAGTDSESDHDSSENTHDYSRRSSYGSASSREEESSCKGSHEGNASSSQKSSAISQFSLGRASTGEESSHEDSRKSTNSSSRKSSRKSKGGNVSSRRSSRSSKKIADDGSISLSRKSSRKSQHGNSRSSSRASASHDESNSSGSSRKNRRRSKKVIKDSLGSTGVSQDESQVLHNQ